MAAEWNALLDESITQVPFLRHEYLRSWWETRGGGEWPDAELAIVIARQDGHLTGVAPLFATRNRDGIPALMLLGSIEISDYLDVIARPADLDGFIHGLLDFLDLYGPAGLSVPAPEAAAKPWQLLDWQNIPENSPTLPVLELEAKERGWSCVQERTYHAPSIPLAGDFDTYLAGIDKKQRHEIRRKMRRAEESDRDVRWYFATGGCHA